MRNHGEIRTRSPVRASTALFPILHSTRIERESASEFSAAQASSGADRTNIHLGKHWNVMNSRWIGFSLGNGGNFAHGFD